jgi:hypothetical protein
MAALLLFAGRAFGQAEDKEPSAVVEIGGAGELGFKGNSSLGPTVAVEVTPVENWLELESGITALFSHGQAEWDTDFLFKKPYRLSDTVEFMFGVGPEWVHATGGGTTSDSITVESVLDFMFWSRPERKYGWYLEPSYGYNFGSGHDQSLGISAGLLISIP